jgi:hypothetical protein
MSFNLNKIQFKLFLAKATSTQLNYPRPELRLRSATRLWQFNPFTNNFVVLLKQAFPIFTNKTNHQNNQHLP